LRRWRRRRCFHDNDDDDDDNGDDNDADDDDDDVAGHDQVPPLPACDVDAMKTRCSAARPYKGVNCTAFNTNGYLYVGACVVAGVVRVLPGH
jgi:hypothetical protein